MTDIERYRAYADHAKKWLEDHAHIEDIIKRSFLNVPTPTSTMIEQTKYSNRVRQYNLFANMAVYHNTKGIEAFSEARKDLKFFSAGVRNLSDGE